MNDAALSPTGAIEIVLVEDNPHDAELTLRVLEKHRLANRLTWVRDGAEALDLLVDSVPPAVPPQLILLDLKLPKVDGHELLRRLKAHPRLRSVPVVVLTSSQEEADVLRAYEAGTNSFIVKPVDFEQFAEAVRALGFYWLVVNHSPAHASSVPPAA